ncbi:uncharacterized protein DUF998 [Murinocardiopsis flavida]|uniref:Uncharacterized protein DUF998 n=1 Tax=Murinocardiopsis flavida TaxID=645275 RepID=A0A2P8D3Q6_9ACTN|nr:DUF998 domain-containing protein [Murinocardiopsis flavida]PSK91853.1 uncharacterized protein DUF998 [Murinocardiopsis flavida]
MERFSGQGRGSSAADGTAWGPADPAGQRTVRALLACGVAAGLLFVGVFLGTGAVRADYDPVRHPVSSLALGDTGWTQTAAFIASGLLMAAFAVGLRRALGTGRASVWGPLLIGLWGVGLIGAGIYTTDPVSGYPPGTADLLTEYSPHGLLHDLFSTPVFLAPPAACVLFALRFVGERRYGWAAYSVATAVGFTAATVLASLGFGQVSGFADLGGLLQRIALVTGFAWAALLAVRALRTPSEVPLRGARG